MPRTTIKLDDDLLARLKERAAREGRSFQSLTNDLLRRSLADPGREPYRLELLTFRAETLPGVDLCDRDALFDLMEGR